MSKLNLTAPQQQFVDLRQGNILVSASAGSGKTFTMIQKLVELVLNNTDLKKLLVVTYTNASASEMKQRLYSKLVECLAEQTDENKKDYIAEQIDSIDGCDIGTLHSVCKKILQNYFYVAEIDPAFELITDKEQEYLFDLATTNVFNRLVAGNDETFYNLYTLYNNKRNYNELKAIVKRLYEFSLSKIDYNEWKNYVLNECCDSNIENNKSARYVVEYYKQEVKNFEKPLQQLLCVDEKLAVKYGEYVKTMLRIIAEISCVKSYAELCKLSKTILLPTKPRVNNKDVDDQTYNETLSAVVGDIKKLFENMCQVVVEYSETELDGMKLVVTNLFWLKELVEGEYKKLKTARNALDFSDLEHLTLKILKNETVREQISEKYDYIFVDEYQDINQVQEKIITSISRNNMNMIGDLKQSIYQFRLSSPEIFIGKYNDYSENHENGTVVNLNNNFRSEPNILEFANFIFDVIMTKNTIGIDYKTTSRLVPGKENNENCVVDVDILNTEDEGDMEEPELIAQNIVKLVSEGYDFKDIAILLRSKGDLALGIIEKLKEFNIPCDASYKTKLFANNEILVIYSLLKVINNSHDDLSLATCLKSLFCGLTEQQLLLIRENLETGNFYEAVKKYQTEKNDEISEKINNFYNFITDCRFKLNNLTILELLQDIFVKYMVVEYYSSFKDGRVRVGNINQFLKIVNNNEYKYDLAKCLDYLDGLKEKEETFDVSGGSNSVKIMTIHASKGLEFPAVVVGGIGKAFRINVNTNTFIINDKLGLGVKILNKNSRSKRESIVVSACKLKNKIDEINEEIRLLYVALTRAKSRMIVVGSANLKTLKSKHSYGIYSSRNYLELMCKALSTSDMKRVNNGSIVVNEGAKKFRLNVISPEDENTEFKEFRPLVLNKGDGELLKKLEPYYNYTYPYKNTNIAIKNTVTSILKEEVDYENKIESLNEISKNANNNQEVMALGTAYHTIMQNLSYTESYNEVCTLIANIKTSDLPYDKVDVSKIMTAIEVISKLKAHAVSIKKEQQFVMKVNYSQVVAGGENVDVLVQGVIDLVVENKDSAIIVDFKTNKTHSEKALKDSYSLQLKLYANAYEKATKKKVSKMYLYSFEMGKLIEIK